MIALSMGLVLERMILVVHPQPEVLMQVAMCFTLCLVSGAMPRSIQPAPLPSDTGGS